MPWQIIVEAGGKPCEPRSAWEYLRTDSHEHTSAEVQKQPDSVAAAIGGYVVAPSKASRLDKRQSIGCFGAGPCAVTRRLLTVCL